VAQNLRSCVGTQETKIKKKKYSNFALAAGRVRVSGEGKTRGHQTQGKGWETIVTGLVVLEDRRKKKRCGQGGLEGIITKLAFSEGNVGEGRSAQIRAGLDLPCVALDKLFEKRGDE